MHRLGGVVLGAIEGHQQLVRKQPKVVQQALVLQALTDLPGHLMEVTRPERIAQVADMMVTGNLRNAKQRAGSIFSLGLLERGLVRQKRRRLHGKDAKGAPGSVLDYESQIYNC
jgi:hypothetical protein